MAVVRVENAGRYGTVHADSSDRVTGFVEKTGDTSPGLINAGIYIFKSAILEYIPDGSVSLEKEVFPRLLDHGTYASRQQGMFIDIGTPADYTHAQSLIDRLRSATGQEIVS
jgi:NDP-sugar pyrophosphorylase family protein